MESNSNFGKKFLKSSNRNGDKTKVIKRIFDIPTGNKSKLCDVNLLRGNKNKLAAANTSGIGCTRNSNQSQHVVPSVTRVYPARKANTNQTVTFHKSAPVVLSPSVPQKICDINLLSSNVPLVMSVPKSQEISQSVLPEKPLFLVPVETGKEVALKTNVPRKPASFSKKITLNNVPDGLLDDSAEIIDSQLVGDKKIILIRTKKNPDAVSSKLEKVLSNSSENSCFNSEKHHEVLVKQPSVIPTVPDVSSCIDVNNSNIYSPLRVPPNDRNDLIMAPVSSSGEILSASESEILITDKQVVHCVPNLSNYMTVDSLKEKAYKCKGTKGKEHCQKEPFRESTVDFEGKNVVTSNIKILKYVETNASHSTLKRKLIPADVTHPSVGHISEKLTSENIKPRKLSNTIVELQMDAACNEVNTDVLLGSIQNAENLCMINSPSQLLDPNSDTSENSSRNFKQNMSTNVSGIFKQNIDNDLYRKREKIALQYQQEAQKAKVQPRQLKTIQLPARTVHVVDIATQTSLFSLVEPGRIIEMHVRQLSKDSKDCNPDFESTRQNMPISTSQNSKTDEKNMNSVDSRVHIQNNYTVPSVRKSNEEMNDTSSKRMRIVSRDHSLLNAFSDVSISSDMSSENQIDTYRLGTQSNVNNVDVGEKNTVEPLDIENKLMLTCSKLTEKFSNTNLMHIKKKVLQKVYLDYKRSLVQDDDGNLPLHHDVMDKDILKVRKQLHILSAQKETVNVKNKMGETPLHLAVICVANEIAQDLIKWGADLSLEDNIGNTALHMAILWADETCLKILMKYIEVNSPLLNKTNDNGYSPLHLCALNNKENEAKMLISKGADINLRDRKSGRTPLFHAVERGYHKMCRTLVDLGASTTITNFSGQNPLNATEVNLGPLGTCKCAEEEEWYSTLCQSLQQVTADKDYLQEKGGKYNNAMNVNVLGIGETEEDHGLSLVLLNRNSDKLQMPKNVEILYKYNNR